MSAAPEVTRTRAWLFIGLLALYLLTGGGKGYSIDGAFGYEMAKTALVDPEHVYFQRFKSAFARWGALLPLLGQPLVIAGDTLARAAPERDALSVDGHTFRVEEWPTVTPGVIRGVPLPAGASVTADALALVSFMANGLGIDQAVEVAKVRLWSGDQLTELPIRAGIETAEWAYDRPDVRGTARHGRPRVVGHWIGQPRGNLYYAVFELPPGTRVTRWELVGVPAMAASGAQWHLRAAAFRLGDEWRDAYSGERYWSERETRDFFTRLTYSTLNAFATAASATLVYAIAGQLGLAETTRLTSALGYGVLTMAWPYAKLDFSEPASTGFTLLAVWALFRAFPPIRGDTLPTIGATLLLGGGAAASLLLSVVGKYTAALGAAAVMATWAVSSDWWRAEARGRAVAFAAATALPAAVLGAAGIVLMALYAGETPVVFRNALERAREDWLALPLWTGLRGLLFSPGKSLFLYSPWLLLAVPGAMMLWRRVGHTAALFTLYPAVVVLLYSMKLVWHGGGWGPRYLLPIVPFLALAAAPAIEWCTSRRRGRHALTALAVCSCVVQLLGIAKDPETFPTMVREHVVRALPDMGSRLGGRDYWLARGGPGLGRALVDPTATNGRRGLGYVWGYPSAEIEIQLAETRTFDLSVYFVDWDRQQRRQSVTLDDAMGRRTWELDRDFAGGLWASWQVTGTPAVPIRLGLVQRGADTAVASAMTFDAARIDRIAAPVVDASTRGDWVDRFGREGYALFAWHSFNVDLAARPPYVARIEVTHVGDKPDPRIHVEVAEQDLLDTPLLYSGPFSPLLGNAWLLAADLANLTLPQRPDVTAAVLARPTWSWVGIAAPRIEHPEFGLGLDFWPTLLYTNYASHPRFIGLAGGVLLTLEATLLAAVAALTPSRWRWRALVASAVALAVFDWLQISA